MLQQCIQTILGIPEEFIRAALLAVSHQSYLDTVISPEIAAVWLEKLKFDSQRKIYEHIVSNYKIAMETNDLGITEPIIIGIVDGKPYLLNGYHRLMALILWGYHYRFSFTIRWFNTFAQMEAEYGRMDRGKPRSDRELIQTCNVFKDSFLKPRLQQDLLTAIKVIDSGFAEPSNAPNQMRAHHRSVRWLSEQAREWLKEAEMYANCTSHATSIIERKMWIGSVAAVYLMVLKHQPEKAKEYIVKIAKNSGLEAGTPEHSFMNQFLLTLGDKTENRKRDEQGKAKRTTVWYGTRFTAFCWNRHYQNRLTGKGVRIDKKAPFYIEGTSFGPGSSSSK